MNIQKNKLQYILFEQAAYFHGIDGCVTPLYVPALWQQKAWQSKSLPNRTGFGIELLHILNIREVKQKNAELAESGF